MYFYVTQSAKEGLGNLTLFCQKIMIFASKYETFPPPKQRAHPPPPLGSLKFRNKYKPGALYLGVNIFGSKRNTLE